MRLSPGLMLRFLSGAIVLVLCMPVRVTDAQSVPTATPIEVVDLEVNGARFPLGIDDRRPAMRWALRTTLRGVRQAMYQLRVATSEAELADDATPLWETKRIASAEPSAIYDGPPLTARTRYFWTVRVWTAGGADTGWSDPAWFETAMLDPREWKAEWIAGPPRPMTRLTPEEGAADDEVIRAAGEFCRPVGWPVAGFFPDAVPNPEGACRAVRPAPKIRRTFELSGPVEAARIYVTGLGYVDLTLNGASVSDAVLDPGFTDFSETVLYTTHDVTDHLQPGENVLAARLGSGQFDSSTRTWDWGWDIAEWRAEPRLRLELHVRYSDGSTDVIRTDESWKVSVDGPVRFDSYYLGETYDARREIDGWNRPGFDASSWSNARAVDAPRGVVRAQTHEPIRVVDVREPGVRSEPAPGIVVYDVGQNLAGWARIRVDAPAGTPVEIFYSEKLDSTGRAVDDPGYALVGGQLQTDYFIARGSGDEVWTPRFSYKGFRYVQLSSPAAAPLPPGVDVRVDAIEQVRTDVRRTSTFASGSELLNRIHENTRWAVESNLHGIITDTPVYEKNAWTGDAQLSAGVIATLFDAERLYRKLSQDMVDAQTDQGEVPLLAPSNEHYGYVGKPAFKPTDCCGATPPWDAFWFVLPWESYQRYGDSTDLHRVYPAMKRYLDEWIPQWTSRDGDEYAHTLTAGLGDWDPPEGIPTNNALSATAYYAHFARITAGAARVLGLEDEATHYDELFERIRDDFNARFLSPDGRYRDAPDDPFTQTAQVLPLAFDLAPDSLRDDLVAALVDDLRRRGGNAHVGILGARYILPVLTRAGHVDAAFQAATQTDYPSWGYWIDALGWTSLGEYWEATSRSRNHHFFGTIVQWMYEDLAGIRPLEQGFARIAFHPEIPTGLDSVSVSYESVRGTVASAWRQTPNGLELEVTVPPTAVGVVHVPAAHPESLVQIDAGRGSNAGDGANPTLRLLGGTDGRVIYEVGSGTYRFRVH